MRLIIVRHGDPDYEKDSLTETGWIEAELLSDRLCKMDITDFYVSPLGRAQDTARPTLEKLKRSAEILPWLREFEARIMRPDVSDHRMITWDWLPEDWTAKPEFFHIDSWCDEEHMLEADVKKQYKWVCDSLDELLEKYGYFREGKMYRTEGSCHDTVVLICHFGLECVILSHLLGISPMLLWHGFSAAPTSVTTIYTEERRPGKVWFRVNAMGDVSHLSMAGREPSFAARFSECYDDEFGRLD